jgi:ABC-type branched-subunit amino acid transport system substrate-binding protein
VVSLPKGGALTEYGKAVKNGMILAQETKPEVFKQIRFIFEDDQYLPKNTLSAVNKLIDIDHINLLFLWGN